MTETQWGVRCRVTECAFLVGPTTEDHARVLVTATTLAHPLELIVREVGEWATPDGSESADMPECESCHKPITDDAEAFDCPRYSGPVHVGCHPADCRSVECGEALTDPTQYADERD